jgi:hypothetical protein
MVKAEQILRAMRKMNEHRKTVTHSKHLNYGEPDGAKGSSPVRMVACGKVPEKATASFLPYYTIQVKTSRA